ncbi:MAG TPA: hypothetical protein VKE22_20840 [Haliangiales bacterium]|nr:hypothetical protein [Haliangiales bacterium]
MPRRALLLFLVSAQALAGDGARVWRTLESAHFVVSYYEPLEDVARRVAVCAERAHRVLTPILGHAPAGKTQIVVTDDTDGSNGSATVLPRNQINLFATAPDALSVLNDHDDWLYGLVLHEYTHIVHLDTIGWVPRLFNMFAGKRWAPNGVQPRWFIEGLAVYEESKRSASGRTRSAIFDMYLRGAVLAGKEIDLDAMSSGPYFWPHGNAAYLYGSFFLQYIGDRYGDDKLARISHYYGEQPVPWGLNRAVFLAVGKTYETLYDEWMAWMRQRYALQRDVVLRRGLREGEKLTNTGETNDSPHFTPDGERLVWFQANGKELGTYRAMPAAGRPDEASRWITVESTGDFAFLPGGNSLVAERFITYRTNYAFTDLFRIDVRDGLPAVTRLTTGARAATPDVSRDGARVAFTVNGGARRRLAWMPLAPGAAPEILWEGGRWEQAFDPHFSHDGRKIVFSTWGDGGYDDIWLYDVDARRARPLTHDRAIDNSPRFSPDDRWVYFSSDRTGIYNIFALELDTGRLMQVTNVIGGAFAFDVSPDGKLLAYIGFDDDGTELYRMPLDPARFLPAEPYVDDRPPATAVPDGESPTTAARPYRPLDTLGPLRYEVRFQTDSFGDAVNVTTSGNDVAGIMAWSLGATYGYTRGDVSFGAGYGLFKYWPSLGVSVGRGVGRGGGLVLDGRDVGYAAESWTAAASVGLPVLRLPETFADLSLAYDVSWMRNLSPPPVIDPNIPVPSRPETGVNTGFSLRWLLSDVRAFTFTLGPVQGRNVAFGLRLENPAIGSRHRLYSASWSWEEFFRLPFESVFSLRYSGGIAQNDTGNGAFFGLGGKPQQDILDAIINSTRVGSVWLHGYTPGVVVGNQFHLVNLELRARLAFLERGLSTLPFYVRRLHVAALFDAGAATTGALDLGDLRTAVGASLRLDAVFGYYVAGTFDVGVARGLSRGGQTELWFLLTGGI